jgi:hypothetical protein
MRSKIAMVVILVALVWGLEEVMVSPLKNGSAYPEYSSLNSEPMGALALYESLAQVTSVGRLYKAHDGKKPAPGTTILMLGVDPLRCPEVVEKNASKELENLMKKGVRLVIAFLPVKPNWPVREPAQFEANNIWGAHFRFGPDAMPWQAGPEWTKIDPDGLTIERRMGAGSVVLAAYSYPVSNQGLRDDRDAAYVSKLIGPANRVLFDEDHLGIVETGSVTKLMRKYHLEGALAVLALVAGLFLWRSGSSLLPSRAPRADQAVAGRDSIDGMAALLRRGIAEKDLVRVCYEEWKRTSLNDPNSQNIDADDALFDHKNAADAYKALMEKL